MTYVNKEREAALDAAMELDAVALAKKVIHGSYMVGVDDTVLLEKVAVLQYFYNQLTEKDNNE